MTRLVCWNILQGGGRRLDHIATYLTSAGADIVALQEYRPGPLADALKKAGLTYQFCASDSGDNTLFLAARSSFDAGDFITDRTGICHIIEADFTESGLTLLNIHFPQKKLQVPLFEALAEDTPSLIANPTLMVGDMNCGIPFEDSTGKTFTNTSHFRRLLSLGWKDAWRLRHGETQEFTWISPRTGNGFRYDHCFASGDVEARIASVEYDHTVREKGLSDHSAMLIEFEL